MENRESPLSNRTILKKIIKEEIDIGELTAVEQSALEMFKGRLNYFERLCMQKIHLGRAFFNSFGADIESDAAQKARQELDLLSLQIEAADEKLTRIEEMSVLKPVIDAGMAALYQLEQDTAHERFMRSVNEQKETESQKQVEPPSAGTPIPEARNADREPKNTFGLFARAKEWIVGTLGAAGYIVWFVIGFIFNFFPLIMLDFPFLANFALIICMTAVPYLNIIVNLTVWIWALVVTISGPQDVFAIAYYVVFAINTLIVLSKIFKTYLLWRYETKR